MIPAASSATDGLDRLTGLASRDTFVRAIAQADRDRDRMLVAVFAVDDLPEINRAWGWEAGDELLQDLGRALAARASVDVVVARLDGTRFGLLWNPAGDDDPARWMAPALDDLREAARRWTTRRIELGLGGPIGVDVVAGVAAGVGGDTWTDAEIAIGLVGDASTGRPAGPGDGAPDGLVVHDPAHPGVEAHHRRLRRTGDLARSLRTGELRLVGSEIETLVGDPPPGRRLRVRGSLPTREGDDPAAGPDGWPGTALARALGVWTVERAVETALAPPPPGESGPTTVVVPLPSPSPMTALDRLVEVVGAGTVAPERFLVELAIDRLRTRGDAPALVRAVATAAAERGFGVVAAGVGGGWEDHRLLTDLPIDVIEPDPSLVIAAGVDEAATHVLEALRLAADRAGRRLVAPPVPVPDRRLVELGFPAARRDPEPVR